MTVGATIKARVIDGGSRIELTRLVGRPIELGEVRLATLTPDEALALADVLCRAARRAREMRVESGVEGRV